MRNMSSSVDRRKKKGNFLGCKLEPEKPSLNWLFMCRNIINHNLSFVVLQSETCNFIQSNFKWILVSLTLFVCNKTKVFMQGAVTIQITNNHKSITD